MHGVRGIWGVLAVLISNDEATVGGQLAGIGAIFVFVFIYQSAGLGRSEKSPWEFAVDEEAEYEGLDASECGMEAYPEFVSSRSDS